jgi:hypothetical protein
LAKKIPGTLLLLAGAAAPAFATAIPSSAVGLYMTPISADQLHRYARIIAPFVARAGAPARLAGIEPRDSAFGRLSARDRARIIEQNGLSVAVFDRIAAQVRYDQAMATRVREDLNIFAQGLP